MFEPIALLKELEIQSVEATVALASLEVQIVRNFPRLRHVPGGENQLVGPARVAECLWLLELAERPSVHPILQQCGSLVQQSIARLHYLALVGIHQILQQGH